MSLRFFLAAHVRLLTTTATQPRLLTIYIPALSSNVPRLPTTLSSTLLLLVPMLPPLLTTYGISTRRCYRPHTHTHTNIVDDGPLQCISCCRTPARHPLALSFSTLSSSLWPPQVRATERRSTRKATGCREGDACCYSLAVGSAHPGCSLFVSFRTAEYDGTANHPSPVLYTCSRAPVPPCFSGLRYVPLEHRYIHISLLCALSSRGTLTNCPPRPARSGTSRSFVWACSGCC